MELEQRNSEINHIKVASSKIKSKKSNNPKIAIFSREFVMSVQCKDMMDKEDQEVRDNLIKRIFNPESKNIKEKQEKLSMKE